MFSVKKTKKIRKRSLFPTQLRLQRKKYIAIIGFSFVICIFFYIAYIIYHISIGNPKFIIKKVVYDPVSLAYITDIQLYTTVTTIIQDRNYLYAKWLSKKNILSEIREKYPLVQDINLQLQSEQTVFITVQFSKPKIIFQTPSSYFASYNEQLYLIQSGSRFLWEQFAIQLPAFSAQRTGIDWIFRKISENSLYEHINLILNTLSPTNISEIIYQPWGQRLFLSYKGKRIYINLAKNVQLQLEKILTLENNRAWFKNVRTIDPWSREETIVQ